MSVPIENVNVAENAEVASNKPSKEEVVNRLVAEGLNSLIGRAAYTPVASELLNSFCSLSLDKIRPCWDYLDLKVQFEIFKFYKNDFLIFMEKGKEDKNEF